MRNIWCNNTVIMTLVIFFVFLTYLLPVGGIQMNANRPKISHVRRRSVNTPKIIMLTSGFTLWPRLPEHSFWPPKATSVTCPQSTGIIEWAAYRACLVPLSGRQRTALLRSQISTIYVWFFKFIFRRRAPRSREGYRYLSASSTSFTYLLACWSPCCCQRRAAWTMAAVIDVVMTPLMVQSVAVRLDIYSTDVTEALAMVSISQSYCYCVTLPRASH